MLDKLDQKIINYLRDKGEVTLAKAVSDMDVVKSTLFYKLENLVKLGLVRKRIFSKRTVVYILEERGKLELFIKNHTEKLNDLLFQKKINFKNKPSLVFVDAYILPERYIKILSKNFDVKYFSTAESYIDSAKFVSRAKDADIVVCFSSTSLDKETLDKCRNLKYIISPTLDVSYIDLEWCEVKGIKVLHLSDENSYKRNARREFVFAALLSLLRPIKYSSERLKFGGEFVYDDIQSFELGGKKVGVVGVKREGSMIIPVLKLFGCEVLASTTASSNVEPFDVGLKKFVSVKEIIEQADIVIFPEELEVKMDISKFLNNRLKPDFLLFLTHSVTYDVKKLKKLLDRKVLLGVFIDYYPDLFGIFKNFTKSKYKEIINLENVIITPEIGFYTKEAMERNYDQTYKIIQSLNF